MKALFFLRHNNDIDHITPVIFKWVNAGHSCNVILIGKSSLESDFRLVFLKQLKGVKIIHIRKLLSRFDFVMWRFQTLLLVRSSHVSFFGPAIRVLAGIYNFEKRQSVWLRTVRHILDYGFAAGEQGVVVFDWIERNSAICVEWVAVVIAQARNKKLGTVSLPHGDSPHASQLIRHGEWFLKPDVSFSAAGMFDKVVVPNELCSKRFRTLLRDDQIEVLGSPRYCDEWLTKLKEIMPPSSLMRSDSQLKIVIFLRKARYTTFWEEVAEVVQLIAAFPNIEVIIKPHTRGGWKQPLIKNTALKKLSNVTVADGGTHSIHLMNWADVIIDLATSVVYEAIKAGKPVLSADYLHASRSAAAVYMPETELRCRDDVYKMIDTFLTTGTCTFYKEPHRQLFMQEMIDAGGKDVLSNYVALLERQAQRF
ncbi:hypothetical protein [Nitrosomonas aestuarii]|uniref:hypothetical protein n=1 Tax=Nitrosomonas aestuarii TaxID=52441 RepID=UPI000D3199D6|nr:hypothetical protein [Nitrosomonas aestuarii]PTN10874.1 hypothetical protein C8R11_11752 [Nitrosomonas aestuarii]